MSKSKKPRRPSRFEEAVVNARMDSAHQSSARIMARHKLLACEHALIEEEIVALSAAITKAKQRREQVHANMIGLMLAYERRG